MKKEKDMRKRLSKQVKGLGKKTKGAFADTLVGFMGKDQKNDMYEKAKQKFKNHPEKEKILKILRERLNIKEKNDSAKK
jgi:hypothetical protein